jgi:hypothetical protein
MVARIIFQGIKREKNAMGRPMAYLAFEIASHDGSVTGQVGVPDANDATVMVEAKKRLRELLRDALKDLDSGPLGSG